MAKSSQDLQRLKVIGKSLQKQRLKTGYSQEEVAGRIGITPKSYGAYEQGTSAPDILRLIQIAEIFECEIGELLGGISSKPDDQAKHIANLLQGVKRIDRLHIIKIVEKICLISKGKAKIDS
ncbi:helix-turn-helix transcriptional regulator [Ralstonia pseudosolanacearum]|uniref:helix-turn-helix domain-containing protein n=1 Tax=Ralstonia pseudosolanacearum TaxID=1310165 RepID=UPI0009C0639C|nr:helix-turn-helix transcriptional regulator [Ralstonia pseudosolanacearum]MCK4161424.1 helix-turn-helix transcriptional regulator [Ralstonia pseudosolanacearum]